MSQKKPFAYSCQPPGIKKCFIKGEALRRLRSDSSHAQTTFEKNIKNCEKRLPCPYFEKVPLWIKIRRRETALQQSNKSARKNHYLLVHDTGFT